MLFRMLLHGVNNSWSNVLYVETEYLNLLSCFESAIDLVLVFGVVYYILNVQGVYEGFLKDYNNSKKNKLLERLIFISMRHIRVWNRVPKASSKITFFWRYCQRHCAYSSSMISNTFFAITTCVLTKLTIRPLYVFKTCFN